MDDVYVSVNKLNIYFSYVWTGADMIENHSDFNLTIRLSSKGKNKMLFSDKNALETGHVMENSHRQIATLKQEPVHDTVGD